MAFLAWMGMAAIAALTFHRKIEETLPLTVFFSVSVMFMTGMLGHLTAGLWIIALVAAAGAVYVIVNKKWCTEVLFTPGFLFLIGLFLLASQLHQYRVVADWDEMAQWALAPKNMYVLNQIPVPETSNMIYTSYPPGTSIYCYLWCKFMGSFEDSALYIAMMFLNIGVLAPVWKTFTWKKWGRLLPCVFLLLVAPRAFLTMSWNALLVDYLLGAITVSLLYQYLTSEGTMFDWLYAAFGLFMLVQVKETGVFFAALYLAAVAADQWFGKEKADRWSSLQNTFKDKKRWIAVVVVVLIPFCGKLLWSWFLSKNGIAEFWGGGEGFNLSLLNVFDRNNGAEPWQRTGFKNFWLSMFNYKFSSRTVFYLHNIEVPLVVWYGILMVGTVLLYLLQNRQRRISTLFVVLWLGNIVFTVGLAYMYYLKLSQAENEVLSAYSRYIGTVNSAIWLMGILLFLRHISTCQWSVGVVAAVIVLAVLPQYRLTDLVLTTEQKQARVEQYENRQKEYERALQLSEYIQDGTTIIFNGKSYLYNYMLAPIGFGGPLGDAIITDFNYFLAQIPYKKYVYLDDMAGNRINEDFIAQYGHRFFSEDGDATDEIFNHGLYRALYHPDGTAMLQYITTINVSER